MQALTEVTSALDATCLVYTVLLAFLAFALLGAPAFVDSHFLYTSTLLYSRLPFFCHIWRTGQTSWAAASEHNICVVSWHKSVYIDLEYVPFEFSVVYCVVNLLIMSKTIF